MKDKYTGSLGLEWYNKQKTILLRDENNSKETDVPAPSVNWINKDEALFYEIIDQEGKGLEPYWVDRNDIRVKEARPLIFKKAYEAIMTSKEGTLPGLDLKYSIKEISNEKEANEIENILIKGDNLLALNTLKKHFDKLSEMEKVKCIYIDPPFNTGQAFEYYEDNLAHSEWLTLMRDRLILLKGLLRFDGFIIIHLDNVEIHYCKVMLDEIFGRNNFITHIAYERSAVAGLGQGGLFVNTAEAILIYHNGEPKSNVIYEVEDLPIKTMKRYNKYVVSFGEKELVKELKSKSNDLPIKIYKHKNYEIETISMAKAEERYSELQEIYRANLETIFRPFLVQQENEFQHELMSHMDEKSLYSVEYIPSRGKNKDQLTTLHYMGHGLFAWLKDTTEESEDGLGKKTKMSNFWRHSEIPKADLHNEGGVSFARNKKPENLLARLIEFSTDEGDTILDCFGGSGTTFATAHKMGRNWIGIELGDHIESLIIPRLKNVLDGTDQTGISKKMNWKGGGSFKYYQLGESIIKIGKDKSVDFNWKLGKSFIEESFLLSYDYELLTDFNLNEDKLFKDETDSPKIGIQKIGNKIRIAIITLCPPDSDNIMLKYDELHGMYKKVMDKYKPEFINVFTNKGVEIAFETKPEKLEVIKVPTAIYSAND
jgi:hypothetical protein